MAPPEHAIFVFRFQLAGSVCGMEHDSADAREKEVLDKAGRGGWAYRKTRACGLGGVGGGTSGIGLGNAWGQQGSMGKEDGREAGARSVTLEVGGGILFLGRFPRVQRFLAKLPLGV